MKSFYFRNFIATAVMIALCLLLVAGSVFSVGRGVVVEDYIRDMRNSAEEVAHSAYAVTEEGSLDSWMLSMMLSSISKATGNHIFLTDYNGMVVVCCDDIPYCKHLGVFVPAGILSTSVTSIVSVFS